jgi:uncharacterized protein
MLAVAPSPPLVHPEHVEKETRRWILDHVVRLNLCPFAKKSITSNSLEVIVSKHTEADKLREEIVDIAVELSKKGNMVGSGTVVIAAPYVDLIQDSFHEYLYFSEEVSHDMSWSGLLGDIQLASFHPKYQFEDTEEDDITNFTNKSPWPLFHLLREAEVSAAVETCKGNTDWVWQANQETMHKEGKAKLDEFLNSFSKEPTN